MRKFLTYCKTLLNPEGIIILDSFDFRSTKEKIYLKYQERNRKLGKYLGVTILQLKYKNIIGDKIQNLQIDPETLKEITSEMGFSCKILGKEEDGNYLTMIST